ncbi:hypothetical protein BSL78_22282 [Apostichopus japonicus]|uniref:Uncharacterized protein n=1 Tax=Stichopus japonicus TaxID=307972 RepID=A0A2G8JYP2_STIJA|nr:hypothetical protein BSL78_22282 [Apostichopus japonicus]
MNPRAPHLDEEHEPTTLDCLKVFYDKCCRDYAELTESELLRLAASLLIGAATFPVCLGVFQKLVFTPLKISNVSFGSDMLGMCVVAVSGITATHFTSRVWEFLTGKKFHILFEYAILNPQYVLLLTVYIFSIPRDGNSPEEAVIVGGVSLAVFLALRGKVRSVLPSNVLHPGAFAKESLPASDNYATSSQRSKLMKFGKRYGCHSCGARFTVQDFIADHQPPLAVMRRKRSSMLHIFKEFSRLFKRKKNMTLETPQRFYPQCTRCSVKQLSYLSAVSRGLRAPSPVVNHFTSLRLCHIFLPFPLLVVSAYRFCAVRE